MVNSVRTLNSTKHSLVRLAIQLHKRRYRDSNNLFLIEGLREIQRAIAANVEISHLFCRELALSNYEIRTLVDQLLRRGTEFAYMSQATFSRVCYRDSNSSLLAIAKTFSAKLSNIPTGENALYLTCVGIEKPGNLGAIMRTADSAGVDGLIVCDGLTDIFHPNTIRNSLGTMFAASIAITEFSEFKPWIQNNNIQVVASSPRASDSYVNVNYSRSTAIVVGSEAKGLDDTWCDIADKVVSLPQYGVAESLNASVTAAIMVYEARRQKDCSD